MRDNIRKYLNKINLNDYDLGGVELTEEDIDNIENKINAGSSLEEATDDVLYAIRECLD